MRKPSYFKRNGKPSSASEPEQMTGAPVLRKCVGCGRNHVEGLMLDAPGGGKSCGKCYPKLTNKGSYRLPDQHLEAAKMMLGLSHPNKNCRYCYGRGYTGVNNRNEVISCKCVDADLSMYRWKSYVRAHADLHEAYRWALEGESVQKCMDELKAEPITEGTEKTEKKAEC